MRTCAKAATMQLVCRIKSSTIYPNQQGKHVVKQWVIKILALPFCGDYRTCHLGATKVLGEVAVSVMKGPEIVINPKTIQTLSLRVFGRLLRLSILTLLCDLKLWVGLVVLFSLSLLLIFHIDIFF